MKPKHKRLIKLLFFIILLGISITLILRGFKDSLVYFYSPTEIKEGINKNNKKESLTNKKVRVGGLIKAGSINSKNNIHEFIITDNSNELRIKYKGILPPMFRETQGIVAEGKLNNNNLFNAEKLITKHDEKYMPPEVKKSIIKYGHPENK